MPSAPKTVDAYISGFPPGVQKHLEKLRAIVRSCAPDAEEAIGYGAPAYSLNGPLVYFAAFKRHIGFYAAQSAFHLIDEKVLERWRAAKGTLQFPLDEPVPEDVVRTLVSFRVKENRAKVVKKPAKKKRT
jgi:uncharacterized protein YdhG (YjbR/CyaY superfamily)